MNNSHAQVLPAHRQHGQCYMQSNKVVPASPYLPPRSPHNITTSTAPNTSSCNDKKKRHVVRKIFCATKTVSRKGGFKQNITQQLFVNSF